MAQGQYRVDEDVATAIQRLQESEAERGNPKLSETRALNWLAREGAQKLGLVDGKKVRR